MGATATLRAWLRFRSSAARIRVDTTWATEGGDEQACITWGTVILSVWLVSNDVTPTDERPALLASESGSAAQAIAPHIVAARTALVLLIALVLLLLAAFAVAPALVAAALAELQSRALRFDGPRIGTYALLLGSALAIDFTVLG